MMNANDHSLGKFGHYKVREEIGIAMMTVSVDHIRTLLGRNESEQLDFKELQYALGEGKHPRAELIKDVVAMANAKREEDAFILIGVRETSNGSREKVGANATLRDAEIQQLVNSKTNRAVQFRCGDLEVDGFNIGYIQVAKEQFRPIYLRNDFDTELRANVVYIRFGSSTGQLSPDEIAQLNRPPLIIRNDRSGDSDLKQMAKRWLSVFDNHGIRRTSIPRAIKHPELVAGQFYNWQTTLEVLTEEILEQTCSLFRIRRAWLDGDSDVPYDAVQFDRRMDGVIEAMFAMRSQKASTSILGMKSVRSVGLEKEPRQVVGVILRAEVAETNDHTIYCYQPIFSASWGWSETKYRWYIKSALLAARSFNLNFFGCELPQRTIRQIVSGAIFPHPSLSQVHHMAWNPDDFVYEPSESVVAKEPDDLKLLLEYCRNTGFLEKLEHTRKSLADSGGRN
jgi:Putative DNA-binding domain